MGEEEGDAADDDAHCAAISIAIPPPKLYPTRMHSGPTPHSCSCHSTRRTYVRAISSTVSVGRLVLVPVVAPVEVSRPSRWPARIASRWSPWTHGPSSCAHRW